MFDTFKNCPFFNDNKDDIREFKKDKISDDSCNKSCKYKCVNICIPCIPCIPRPCIPRPCISRPCISFELCDRPKYKPCKKSCDCKSYNKTRDAIVD